jgi:hypothetical protein
MIMSIISAILAGLKSLGVLLDLIRLQQERQAGVDEVDAAAASTLAAADERKIDAIATQGQDDARTESDLSSGRF